MHHAHTGGDKGVAPLLKHARTVDRRGPADNFVEERAKRTQALKAHRQADLGDRKRAVGQQLFGLFYTLADEILMGRLVIGAAKAADQIKTGQMGLLRDLVEL